MSERAIYSKSFGKALAIDLHSLSMTAECIYQFVQENQPKSPKKKIYRSKYDPNGPLIGSTFGMHGTNAVNGKGFHELKKVGPIDASGIA